MVFGMGEQGDSDHEAPHARGRQAGFPKSVWRASGDFLVQLQDFVSARVGVAEVIENAVELRGCQKGGE